MKYSLPDNDILAAVTCSSPLPEHEVVEEIVQICRRRFFQGFYRQEANDIDRLGALLHQQLERVFAAEESVRPDISSIVNRFIADLPALHRLVAEDVEASFNGDPAAESFREVVLCYPGIYAVTNYRVAHRLHELGVPLIPRMIAEQAHSKTGIDIHPGARIGRRFMIDHGTGVVIGATAIIGNDVKIYQGVTLGAKSFTLDDEGNPVKGVARHPHVEDGVVIYANSTILGTVTIGAGSVIGGNLWITADVPAGSRIIQSKPEKNYIIK